MNEEITSEKIDELLNFLPFFENKNQEIISWKGGEETESGIMTMTYPVYSEQVEDFFEYVSQDCWINFDYSPNQVALQMNELFIRQANLSQIKSLLTYALRGERFCDGFWGELFKSGKIVLILKRLRELKKETHYPNFLKV